MTITVDKLNELTVKALRTKYNKADSEMMAEVVMFGELSGKTSHGLVRLLLGNASILAQNPSSKPEIVRKTKLSSIIIGNKNPGMLVAAIATNELIRIASENEIGLVGTRESFSTSGCLSYYLEKIAQHNLIGIMMARSTPSTPPSGGIEPLFGTNPISFGIPANPRPLIFDMGTSAISFGEILKAKALGKSLPEGVAIDSEGNATTDPAKAIEGGTLPFDRSYKGSGLAMIVELLGGLLPGAGHLGIREENGWGNLLLAFSPDLLSDTQKFKEDVSQFVNKIRNSRTKNESKVRIPGEKTLDNRDQAIETGKIEVEDKIFALLQEAAKI